MQGEPRTGGVCSASRRIGARRIPNRMGIRSSSHGASFSYSPCVREVPAQRHRAPFRHPASFRIGIPQPPCSTSPHRDPASGSRLSAGCPWHTAHSARVRTPAGVDRKRSTPFPEGLRRKASSLRATLFGVVLHHEDSLCKHSFHGCFNACRRPVGLIGGAGRVLARRTRFRLAVSESVCAPRHRGRDLLRRAPALSARLRQPAGSTDRRAPQVVLPDVASPRLRSFVFEQPSGFLLRRASPAMHVRAPVIRSRHGA